MERPSHSEPSAAHEDVFSDNFEVAIEDDDDHSLYRVADGFRPHPSPEPAHTYASMTAEARQDFPDWPSRRMSLAADHNKSPPTSIPTSPVHSPVSFRQHSHSENPFVVAEDPESEETSESDALGLQFESDEHDPSQRSSSPASSQSSSHPQRPHIDTSGPSHPYDMYRQDTNSQSPSIGISPSRRTTQQLGSPSTQGPQHPYNLYPQGIDSGDLDSEDASDTDEQIQNPLPMGFMGRGQAFTRRRGPDGEDQEIVGADGHIEQLPPYSRYPLDNPNDPSADRPEKMPLLVPAALHSRAPVAGSNPTMPLMHTALQPRSRPQSMMDESNLPPDDADDEIEPVPETAAVSVPLMGNSSVSEKPRKPWKEKTWREKRRTRYCGIPFWVYLVVGGAVVFVLAVMGGVVGGFVAGGFNTLNKLHKSAGVGAAVVTVVTSLYDASQIPTPTISPVSGTFALTLSAPEATDASCLIDQGQQAAWDCRLAPDPDLSIYVGQYQDYSNSSGAAIFYNTGDNQINYGSQISAMNTSFAEFLTVLDNVNRSDGPAFYFSQQYDKVVVIPENALNSSYLGDQPLLPPHSWPSGPVPAGEKPWFCVWNNTFLEGFIYVTEPAASSAPSVSTGPITASLPMSSPVPSATGTTTGFQSTPTTLSTAVSPPSPPGSAIVTTTLTGLGTSLTLTGAVSIFSAWANAQSQAAQAAKEYFEAVAAGNGKRASWNLLPSYPYLIKLEERRIENNPVQPYCQQYQILDDGSANVVTDPHGQIPQVILSERDPTYAAYVSAGIASQGKQISGRGVPNSCHCQWMAGQAP